MHLLVLLLAVIFCGACTLPSAFDILRAKTEDLGPELHQRATWRSIWQSLIPRDEYPKGAGYVRSTFKIGRSEPATDEEAWTQIQSLAATAQGAGNLTYNQVYVGHHEDTYVPEMFGLMGPLINQDDLTMYWDSPRFWQQFFEVMEKRNVRSIENRLGNIYRQYCYKASARADFGFVIGNWTTQPVPTAVDWSTVLAQQGAPQSELTQEMLDATAEELEQEGAQDGDTNGWISLGESGPEFPLYIGTWMSNRILLNNSELRNDYNQSFMSLEDLNPVIKRIGAKRVIKNFRHVINLFPARWALLSNGQTVQYTSSGLNATTNKQFLATCSISGATATISFSWNGSGAQPSTLPTPSDVTLSVGAGQCMLRIPTYVMSTNSVDVTKGQAAVINGAWRDPSTAGYESVEVLNPLVMTQRVLMPVQSLPGAKLNYQNYFGEWQFVTGNDAMLGIDSCTGVTDPMKKKGRHFGEYRHANEPVHTIFGRCILFKRCSASFDTISCT